MSAARRRQGPVERATRKRLRELPDADVALVALAVALAQRLDVAPNAAVGRELRQTVQVLTSAAGAGDAARRSKTGKVVALVRDGATS